MIGKWYEKKWIAWSLHVLFWALFFLFPYLLRPVVDSNASNPPRHNYYERFIYLHFANTFMRLLLFYANAYVLIPGLVYRKKMGAYLLSLSAALVVMLAWDRFFFSIFIEGIQHKVWNFFVFNILPFIFIVVTSTAYRVIRDRIEDSQRARERETETLKTELSFLRSQVSPHFMFNVLNNMVALARKKSDALEPSLIKLSSLLRYMLYETDEDKVLLVKEAGYLRSYIDLQQQRFGKNVSIDAVLQPGHGGHTIEPMLLIPFVENAFKHGTGLITDARIEVRLAVHENQLHFLVKNKYSDAPDQQKDKTSGIGLSNVKRRLNLLYENQHTLTIDKSNGWFSVDLQLNLH